MGRKKGSKNKPKEDNGTRPVTGLSIVASINSSLSKFARAKEPFDKKPPTINLEDMEGEFEVDPDKKVEFRVPPKDAYDSEKLPDTTIDEHPMYIDASKKGTLVVTDPLVAASLARNPRNADHQNHIPFPEDWDKMGKVDKLKWLTEHRK
jgi:hypothetical protein